MTVIQGDITAVEADAIVNPTNATFYLGGEVGMYCNEWKTYFRHSNSFQLQNKSIIYHFYFCFPGSALEKAGGKEFRDEVKKLSESHGPLELASGDFFLRNKEQLAYDARHQILIFYQIILFYFLTHLWPKRDFLK